MKKMLLLAALALPVFGQQGFDFSSLDKLNGVAKNKTNVTLNADMLKLAANFLGSDGDSAAIKTLVDNLKGVYVRVYEFEKEGQYTEADLAPLRAILKAPVWNKVVESVEGRETSEIWMQPLANNQLGGVAIISTEPRELTVVYINGILKMSDIATLSGNLGIPEINIDRDGKKSSGEKTPKGRKDDEQ